MTESEKEPHADSEYLSTLERGLSVLRAFGRENPQMTLSEVAEVTALSPAAARRCLNTLVKLGYVAKHRRHFLLRPEVMSFASAYLDSMSLGEIVRPHLQAVRDETGDSSSLAVLSGYDILYLVHVSTNRMVRLASGIGTRFPAYATSLGRAMLAFEGTDVQNHYLDTCQFESFTEHTITSRADLRRVLEDIRKSRLRDDPGRTGLRTGLGRSPHSRRRRTLHRGDQLLDLHLAGRPRRDGHARAFPSSTTRRGTSNRRCAASPICCAPCIRPDGRPRPVAIGSTPNRSACAGAANAAGRHTSFTNPHLEPQKFFVKSMPQVIGCAGNRKPPVEYSVLYLVSNRFFDQNITLQSGSLQPARRLTRSTALRCFGFGSPTAGTGMTKVVGPMRL